MHVCKIFFDIKLLHANAGEEAFIVFLTAGSVSRLKYSEQAAAALVLKFAVHFLQPPPPRPFFCMV